LYACFVSSDTSVHNTSGINHLSSKVYLRLFGSNESSSINLIIHPHAVHTKLITHSCNLSNILHSFFCIATDMTFQGFKYFKSTKNLLVIVEANAAHQVAP
jgi:hypothetical protein